MNENNASEEPTHKNQFIELPPLTKSNSKPTVVTNSSGTGTWKDFVPLPSLPKLSGWLQRQDDALFSTWKKRYFRLEGDKLYWFRNDQELEHLGFISLREVEEVSKRRMDPSKSNLFQLELRLKKSRMFLWCEDMRDQLYWLDGINQWKDYFVGQMRSLHNSDVQKQRPGSDPSLFYPDKASPPLSASSTTPVSPLKRFGPTTQKSQSLNFLPDKPSHPETTPPSAQPDNGEPPNNEPNVKTEQEIESLKRIISEKDSVIEEWKKLFNEKDELYKIQQEKLETLKSKNIALEERATGLENELQIIKNREVTISSFLKTAKEQYFKLISTQQNYNQQQANQIQLLLVDKPVEQWMQCIKNNSLQNQLEGIQDNQPPESTLQKENVALNSELQKTETDKKIHHLEEQKEQHQHQPDHLQNSDGTQNTPQTVLLNSHQTVLQNSDVTALQSSDGSVLQNSDGAVLQNSDERVLQNPEGVVLQNRDETVQQNPEVLGQNSIEESSKVQ
eukprot:TRINITY_DN12532_c0_g4_i2.p1 TRINITY_DN12532_c0_g4~~TRINITY_DN12532_c0_g4_i2.p1  ORF type:complete len:504 (+),score=135.26 TRINITY_DN12532_c0_g4_i2:1515-3026(+)